MNLLILDFQRVVEDRYWWTIIGSLVDVVDPVLQNFLSNCGGNDLYDVKEEGNIFLMVLV